MLGTFHFILSVFVYWMHVDLIRLLLESDLMRQQCANNKPNHLL